MNNTPYIFEVTEKNFSDIVLQNSSKIPVITVFIAVWSEHCGAVDEIFISLAKEFPTEFIYAKVDIDEQPDLRKQYKIENVPTLMVFKDAEIVRVEAGVLKEVEARALLRDFGVSHESDELRSQAREKHIEGDTSAAIMLLTQAIQKHPSNTRVAMDMVQIFIDISDLANAESLFQRLPERVKDTDTGRSLNDQLIFAKAAAKTDGIDALKQRIAENNNDYQANFDLSLCLMTQHEPTLALDELFWIIKAKPEFRDGAAKEMAITIIRMIKPNMPESAQAYQRKLNNLLT